MSDPRRCDRHQRISSAGGCPYCEIAGLEHDARDAALMDTSARIGERMTLLQSRADLATITTVLRSEREQLANPMHGGDE